jgi:multidrug efflux pump subunit AcrA (membrane-fusion protein)
LSIALCLAGCGLHGRPTVSRKSASTTDALAASAELARPFRVVAPGIVEPWGGEVALSPDESGQIAEILVEEGQRVEAGQRLAVLEDSAQRAAVEVALADVNEAEAALARLLHGATPEELRRARAEADADDARAAFARTNADRMSQLEQDHAVPRADAQRAVSDAQAQLAIAQASAARLGSVTVGARVEDRAAARARLAAARARLRAAEASLSRRRVLAPRGATILLARFHVGEFFAPGGPPLFVLGDLSRLRVRLEVDEIDAMRLGDQAPCALYGDDSVHLADGEVLRSAPKMGRRGLSIESPTARADVRIREVFIAVPATDALIPGLRVWGYVTPRL